MTARSIALGSVIALLPLFGGCATIINGTTQKIPVSSSPSGATVVVDGESTATTPCTVALKRKRDHSITISKNGYQPVTVQMTRSMSGATAGNLIAGGFLGWGVDAATGAQMKFTQSAVHVTLHRENEAVPDQPGDGPSGVSQRLADLRKLRDSGEISESEYGQAKAAALGIPYSPGEGETSPEKTPMSSAESPEQAPSGMSD